MRVRRIRKGCASWLPIVACALGLAGCGGASKPAAGGSAGTTAATPAIPRTPDGRPDLQGTWSFANLTPMERPREFGDKATITEAEAKEFAERIKVRGNSSVTMELAY